MAEPTLVAVPKRGGRPVAAGRPAIALQEAEPDRYELIKPMRDAVLVDDRAMEALILHLIRAARLHRWGRVHLVVTLPTGAPPLTREVLMETALDSGGTVVDLVDESLAAALGAGLPVREPPACGLLDLGASAVRAALFAGGQVLLAQRLTVGGDSLDREIRDRLEVEQGLLISLATAEGAKRSVGTAAPAPDERSYEVEGRSTVTGRPQSASVTTGWVYETLDLYLKAVEGFALSLLTKAEPDWLQDLGDRGLVLTGGGALLPGLAERLTQRLGFHCQVAEDPGGAVVRGLQRLIREL